MKYRLTLFPEIKPRVRYFNTWKEMREAAEKALARYMTGDKNEVH